MKLLQTPLKVPYFEKHCPLNKKEPAEGFYLYYGFTDCSDFFISSSPYSSPGKKPLQFLQFRANSVSKNAKLQGLRTLP